MLAVIESSILETPIVIDASASNIAAFENEIAKSAPGNVERNVLVDTNPRRGDGNATTLAQGCTASGGVSPKAPRKVLVYNVNDPKLLKKLISILVFRPKANLTRVFLAQTMLNWLLDRNLELARSFTARTAGQSGSTSAGEQTEEQALREQRLEAARRSGIQTNVTPVQVHQTSQGA